jgi:hypothetical protein
LLGYPPPRTITLEPFPVPSTLGTSAEVAHESLLALGTVDASPEVAHELPLAPDILDADPQEVDLCHGPQCNNSCTVCCKENGQTSVCEDTVTKIVDDIRCQTPKEKSGINSKLENSSLSMALNLIGPPFIPPSNNNRFPFSFVFQKLVATLASNTTKLTTCALDGNSMERQLP